MMTNGSSETVFRKRIDYVMAKRSKTTKGETVIYQSIDRKQKSEKHEPHKNEVNSRAPTMHVAPPHYSLSTTNVGSKHQSISQLHMHTIAHPSMLIHLNVITLI